MKYLGDKYVKAYKFYRDQLDDKVSANTAKIRELERTIEFILGKLFEELKNDSS